MELFSSIIPAREAAVLVAVMLNFALSRESLVLIFNIPWSELSEVVGKLRERGVLRYANSLYRVDMDGVRRLIAEKRKEVERWKKSIEELESLVLKDEKLEVA